MFAVGEILDVEVEITIERRRPALAKTFATHGHLRILAMKWTTQLSVVFGPRRAASSFTEPVDAVPSASDGGGTGEAQTFFP